MPVRITKYEQAFDLIMVKYPTVGANDVLRRLEKEGHTEKSICFAVWRSQDDLLKYRLDNRFWGIFVNSVRKWSWPKGDPRWDDYWKRKNEEKRASELAEKLHIERLKKEREEAEYRDRYPGFVYFIQGQCGGPIKIGYSCDVKARLKSIQTGHPDVLTVLGIFAGSPKDEHDLHEEFNSYRVRGEWFQPAEPILEKIKSIK